MNLIINRPLFADNRKRKQKTKMKIKLENNNKKNLVATYTNQLLSVDD